MDLSHEERRKFTRIDLRAYACDHRCHIAKPQDTFDALLIDISPGGARLKMPEPLGGIPLARGELVTLDTKLRSARSALDSIQAEVRWVGEIDFGIQFVPELDLTAGDLQRLLDV
jgi:hypothetical protein